MRRVAEEQMTGIDLRITESVESFTIHVEAHVNKRIGQRWRYRSRRTGHIGSVIIQIRIVGVG